MAELPKPPNLLGKLFILVVGKAATLRMIRLCELEDAMRRERQIHRMFFLCSGIDTHRFDQLAAEYNALRFWWMAKAIPISAPATDLG